MHPCMHIVCMCIQCHTSVFATCVFLKCSRMSRTVINNGYRYSLSKSMWRAILVNRVSISLSFFTGFTFLFTLLTSFLYHSGEMGAHNTAYRLCNKQTRKRCSRRCIAGNFQRKFDLPPTRIKWKRIYKKQ